MQTYNSPTGIINLENIVGADHFQLLVTDPTGATTYYSQTLAVASGSVSFATGLAVGTYLATATPISGGVNGQAVEFSLIVGASNAPSTAITTLLQTEVGDTGNVLSPFLSQVWETYSDKAQIEPRLQYQYAKRQCIELLTGPLYQTYITRIGDVSYDVKGFLLGLLALANSEIVRLEAVGRANRPPAIGILTATAPTQPGPQPVTSIYADGNDPAYRGSPYSDTIWQEGID